MKCDSTKRGTPCTRCREHDRILECFVPPRQSRKKISRRNLYSHEPQIRGSETEGSIRLASHTPTMALDELEYPEEGPSPMISTMMQRSPNELQESSSGIVLQDSSGISPTTDFSSPDEHIEMQTCQRIALGRRIAVNGSKVRAWNETMEFQNNFNATGILGEVLAWAKTREKSSRLVRMIYPSSQILESTEFTTRRDFELLGLDDHDRAFLSAKGVFELPAAQECEEFLEAYFRYVYPYAPIMDRTELLELYSTGEYSAFLMQSLLANVVPYVSKDLIKRAGFPDHGTAQKSFYDKAVLLHDFNCERSQLILLQGSLLLGTQWVSFKLDRDYRFWLSNACRIATRMGLHSAQIEEEVESDFYKLLRRIWWIIYVRAPHSHSGLVLLTTSTHRFVTSSYRFRASIMLDTYGRRIVISQS